MFIAASTGNYRNSVCYSKQKNLRVTGATALHYRADTETQADEYSCSADIRTIVSGHSRSRPLQSQRRSSESVTCRSGRKNGPCARPVVKQQRGST